MSGPSIQVARDVEELSRNVAVNLGNWASEAIHERGDLKIAFAGGSTPQTLYRLLAGDEFRDVIPWQQVIAFWGDERYVPLDHEDSNYRMTRIELLDHVSIQQSNIHPVRTDLAPELAAIDYEETIRSVFRTPAPEIPQFDLILLGIGADGHTASLFPHTDALEIQHRLVVENWVPQQGAMRITFTMPLLHRAHRVVLMAAGQEKADAVARLIDGPQNLSEIPSQCLRDAQGDVMMILEHSAASALEEIEPDSRD